MRILVLLVVLAALAEAQCFDMLQVVSPEASAGVSFAPEVKAMLRLRALPPAEDPEDTISWRAAVLKESGDVQGNLSVRITDSGSGFVCQARLRGGRRRFNIEDAPLDPKTLTLLQCGWQDLDNAPDVLVFRRVEEDAPFVQPDIRELLHDLSSQLLPEKPATGLIGGFVAKVRERLTGGNVRDRNFEDWLMRLPLARLLEPAHVRELRTVLASEAGVTTPDSAAMLRCALSDATAIKIIDPTDFSRWYEARASLRSGWAGSDDPAVRGAFGLAASGYARNSVPNWEEGSVLHEEIRAGRAILPGTPEEQRAALAQLEALARAANATPAITLWAAAVVGIAALLWGTRKFLDRILAS